MKTRDFGPIDAFLAHYLGVAPWTGPMVCCCNPYASAWLKLLECVGLSTGWELGNGAGLLGVIDLVCWGTGLLGGGGLGASGLGFGG